MASRPSHCCHATAAIEQPARTHNLIASSAAVMQATRTESDLRRAARIPDLWLYKVCFLHFGWGFALSTHAHICIYIYIYILSRNNCSTEGPDSAATQTGDSHTVYCVADSIWYAVLISRYLNIENSFSYIVHGTVSHILIKGYLAGLRLVESFGRK